MEKIIDKLACPKCGSPVSILVSGDLVCNKCSSRYEYNDGIIDFLVDKSRRTTLEDKQYDLRGGINTSMIDKVGELWGTVFDSAGVDPDGKSILEIGSGTGALTLGLLRKTNAREIFATDISEVFLRTTLARAGDEPRLTVVRCDCNYMPVSDGGFDVIVGRSILHHLLDYYEVLAQCARILGKGGKAIFFEPILEGKMIVAMFCSMVVELAKQRNDTDLTENDLNIITAIVRNITKASWYPQDRESLAKIEDKFIFTLPGMQEAGLKAGFTSFKFVRDDRPLDPSFWSYFVNTMRLVGIPPSKVEKYRFIGDVYERTYGQFPEQLCEPMGYFCFTK